MKRSAVLIGEAVAGYRRNRRLYRLHQVSVAVSVFLILFFFALHTGAQEIVSNEVAREFRLREITVYPAQADTSDLLPVLDAENVADLAGLAGEVSVSVFNRSAVPVIDLRVGGVVSATPDYLVGVDLRYSTFSMANLASLHSTEGSSEEYLVGRGFQSGDEMVALINDGTSYSLGQDELSEMLGEKIDLVFADGRELTVTIIGVYDQRLSGNGIVSPGSGQPYTPDGDIEIMAESILFSSDVIEAINGTDAFSEVVIGTNDLPTTLALCADFGSRYANQVWCETDAINETLEYLRLFGVIFIGLGSLGLTLSMVNLRSSIMVVAQMRKKSFALRYLLGFTKRKVSMLFLTEVLMSVCRGIFIALVFVYSFGCLAYLTMRAIYSEYISTGISAFFPPLGVTVLVGSIVIVLVSGLGLSVVAKLQRVPPVSVLF